MKIQKKKDESKIYITNIEDCTILNFKSTTGKSRIFKIRKIHHSYIVLKYNGQYLDDKKTLCDYSIGDNVDIDIYLSVKLESEFESKTRNIDMKYNSTIKDLIDRCCQELEVSDISLSLGNNKLCKNTKLLRRYLRKCDVHFKASATKNSKSLPVGMKSQNKVKDISNLDKSTKSKISLKIINKMEDNTFKNVVIEVDPNCSIENLHHQIAKVYKINHCSFSIYYETKILADGNIKQYNITNNETLTLKKAKDFNEQFIINVKNEKNEEQKFLIDVFETVRALKVILREQYNVNVDCIKLCIGDKELNDEDIIRDMDIKNGATVTLTLAQQIKDGAEEMKVSIINQLSTANNNQVKTVSVCCSDTIGCLRQRIETVNPSLTNDDYVLSFRGDILKKDNILSTYDIKNGDEVVVSGSILVRYFVGGNNASAKVSRYALLPKETVAQLKEKIRKKVNMDPKLIVLSFDGKILEDGNVLEEMGVESGSYLMMVATLAGG